MSRRKGRRFRATSVALSPEVLNAADQRAGEAGVSRSEYLRWLILHDAALKQYDRTLDEIDAALKLLTERREDPPREGQSNR